MSWTTAPGSVFFSSDHSSGNISRAKADGTVRRLHTGVYTADLKSDPVELIRSNLWEIVAHFMPDAVIADRTAAEGGAPAREGSIFVVTNKRRASLELPGCEVIPRSGPTEVHDDLAWAADLRLSSDARVLVDNTAKSWSRGDRPSRTLTRSELESWLVRKWQTRPRRDTWLKQLHERALALAVEFGVEDRHKLLDELIGLTARSVPVERAASPVMKAHVTGGGWDNDRVEAFDALASYLVEIPDALDVPGSIPGAAGSEGFDAAFFEAYFSNFIEGTEFTVDEAETIIQSGVPSLSRPEDSHDILDTYRVVSDPVGRSVVYEDADDYVNLIVNRHRVIFAGRPEKGPGKFKEIPNRAGSYEFVHPELVSGTLRRGLSRLPDVPIGFGRAAYVMFVVSEVHPFEDGNGRVARVAMNAELSRINDSRIIIPTVWRNEYMDALRAASRMRDFDLYVRVLAHAWRWTAQMPWHSRQAVDGAMVATNALVDSTDASREDKRLLLP